MKKLNLALAITSIILTLLVISTLVYAWFGIIEKTQPIIIYSGKINLKADLYQIVDEDDILIDEISFSNVVPGDKFYYKLVVKNQGTITGILDASFIFAGTNQTIRSLVLFKTSDDLSYTTFNSNYTLDAITLLAEQETTIFFEVLISEDLEDTVIGDYAEISSINISLTQAD